MMKYNRKKKYYGQKAGARKHFQGRTRYGGQRRGRSRHRRGYGNERIPEERYISNIDENYVVPSIYVEDVYYSDYTIDGRIKRNLERKGYINPTKIQNQVIPVILEGKDVLGLAVTGSGKTGAFLIPLIDKAIRDRSQKFLIIVPTRELAKQIQDEYRDLAIGTNLYSTLIIGGQSIRTQAYKLRRNPNFVIGTPGRLKDLQQRGILRLDSFNNIVLDEVDRMLDMGFVQDIKFLISKLRSRKQTMFFSATMSKEAEKIANTLLVDPVKIQVDKESPTKNVHQDIVKIKRSDEKLEVLKDLLYKDDFTKVLVFSRTKRGADNLSRKLTKTGLRVDAIHGDKSQNKRSAVLSKFKGDKIDILIATDVAARGLDIPNVSHVINYDEPDTYNDYIHRIGRTGRAGKAGWALTFISRS